MNLIFCRKQSPLISGKVHQLCACLELACTGHSMVTSHFYFKNKSLCQKSISCESDIFNWSQHSKQVSHITLSQKHELATSQTPLYTKNTIFCQNRAGPANHKPNHIPLVEFCRKIQAISKQTKHWERSREHKASSKEPQALLKVAALPYSCPTETGFS